MYHLASILNHQDVGIILQFTRTNLSIDPYPCLTHTQRLYTLTHGHPRVKGVGKLRVRVQVIIWKPSGYP